MASQDGFSISKFFEVESDLTSIGMAKAEHAAAILGAVADGRAALTRFLSDRSIDSMVAVRSAFQRAHDLAYPVGDFIEAGSIGERDHQIELAAASAAECEPVSPEFSSWLEQATPDELAGLQASVATVALGGGSW